MDMSFSKVELQMAHSASLPKKLRQNVGVSVLLLLLGATSTIIDKHAMMRCSRLTHPLLSMAAGYLVCVCVGVSCEGITSDCRILC